MRIRRAIPFVNFLLIACFMLTAQSAKSQVIPVVIQDDSPLDVITVSSGPATITCSGELCTVQLIAPAAGATITGTTLPNHFLLTEDVAGTLVSDGLNDNTLLTNGQLGFHSDAPSSAGDPPLGSCSPIPANTTCAFETGGQQFAGSVFWSNGAQYDIFVQSDSPALEPEPASLMLFGSGLVIAGGFLRRRQET